MTLSKANFLGLSIKELQKSSRITGSPVWSLQHSLHVSKVTCHLECCSCQQILGIHCLGEESLMKQGWGFCNNVRPKQKQKADKRESPVRHDWIWRLYKSSGTPKSERSCHWRSVTLGQHQTHEIRSIPSLSQAAETLFTLEEQHFMVCSRVWWTLCLRLQRNALNKAQTSTRRWKINFINWDT